MIKHKIFKYFFLEFVKIFILITLSLSILVWMTQAARLLELITEYGNPTIIYVKYIILNYPKIINNIFILCFAISLFFLFSKFENSNELNIYWLSGISKEKITKIIILITFIIIFFNLILSVFLAPFSSAKARAVLASSKFSLINSLVKENNFNSPLKGLTIYIDKNDNKGNLKGVFIYENNRVIFAKEGNVISSNENSYLKLFNGTTHEKINGNVNSINFKTTVFDFSKYQLQNVKVPKFNERSIFWLYKNINNKNIPKTNEIREEIVSRLFQPFFLLIVSISSCFLLFSNEDKISSKRLKIFTYVSVLLLLIANQALIGISGKDIYYSFAYIIIICVMFLFLYFVLKKNIFD